jgi:hypothetical protein
MLESEKAALRAAAARTHGDHQEHISMFLSLAARIKSDLEPFDPEEASVALEFYLISPNHRDHQTPHEEPERPMAPAPGSRWAVCGITIGRILEHDVYDVSSGMELGLLLGDIGQELVLSTTYKVRPVCPADGGELRPTAVPSGRLLWQCPKGRWECEMGTYHASRRA